MKKKRVGGLLTPAALVGADGYPNVLANRPVEAASTNLFTNGLVEFADTNSPMKINPF